MKHEFKCIKSWIVENPDGTKVEISLGDKVRVKVDEKRVDLNNSPLGEKYNNPMDFQVTSLSKLKFVGRCLNHLSVYFYF